MAGHCELSSWVLHIEAGFAESSVLEQKRKRHLGGPQLRAMTIRFVISTARRRR
jgi:hypothetical protein